MVGGNVTWFLRHRLKRSERCLDYGNCTKASPCCQSGKVCRRPSVKTMLRSRQRQLCRFDRCSNARPHLGRTPSLVPSSSAPMTNYCVNNYQKPTPKCSAASALRTHHGTASKTTHPSGNTHVPINFRDATFVRLRPARKRARTPGNTEPTSNHRASQRNPLAARHKIPPTSVSP